MSRKRTVSIVSNRHIRAQTTRNDIQQQLEQLNAENTLRADAKKNAKLEDKDDKDDQTLAQQAQEEKTFLDIGISCKQ